MLQDALGTQMILKIVILLTQFLYIITLQQQISSAFLTGNLHFTPCCSSKGFWQPCVPTSILHASALSTV